MVARRKKTKIKHSGLTIHDLNLENPDIDEFINSVPEFYAADPGRWDWSPRDRPYKELTRHVVAQLLQDKAPKKNLFVLPSTTGRDIQILKEYDVPAPDARWLCAEKEIEYMQVFKDNAANMQLFSEQEEVVYHSSDFSKNISLVRPFDMAWFDLLSSLTWSHISWLANVFPLTAETDLFFTFTYKGARQLDYPFNLMNKVFTDRSAKRIPRTYGIEDQLQNDYANMRSSSTGKYKSRSLVMDRAIFTQWQILKYIFSNQTFDINCYVYNDGEGMLLFHLSDFKPRFGNKTYYGEALFTDIFNVRRLWYAETTDAKIAKEVGWPKNRVTHFRNINKLVPKGKVPEYKMEKGFTSLLYDTQPYRTRKHPATMIYRSLTIFNPLIEELVADDTVIIKKLAKGIHISTPTSSYKISIDKEFRFNRKKNTFQLPNVFLNPNNQQALFSIFRVLFLGDIYLHQMLCKYVDPSCFKPSQPQFLALYSWKRSFERGERAGAVILPTGMGKTFVATQAANQFKEYLDSRGRPFRLLFVAHQRLIVDQAVKSFINFTDTAIEDVGLLYQTEDTSEKYYLRKLLKSKTLAQHAQSPAVFASVQNLKDINKLLLLNPDTFDLVIFDEFHHYKARTFLPVVTHFLPPEIQPPEFRQERKKAGLPNSERGAIYTLGLTATPFRGDQLDVMEVLENNYLYKMQLNRGIWEGYLAWPDYYIFDDKTDYSSLYIEAKSGKQIKLGKKQIQQLIINPPREKIILDKFKKTISNKKTVGFCMNIAHANRMAEVFNKAGIPSAAIHARSKRYPITPQQRSNIIKDFKAGKIQVLFVKSLFDEGVDIPSIEAILVLRRTNSPVKQIQQLGRGLRLAPKKKNVIILDFMGNYRNLDAIFNMAWFLNLGSVEARKYTTHTINEVEDDDLPVVTPYNLHFDEGVRLIIKHITDEAGKHTDLIKMAEAKKLREQLNLFADDIALRLDVPLGKVSRWKLPPIKASGPDEIALLHARGIKSLRAEDISDEEIIKEFRLTPEQFSHYESLISQLRRNPLDPDELNYKIMMMKLFKRVETLYSCGDSIECIGKALGLTDREVIEILKKISPPTDKKSRKLRRRKLF
jgi:superfamily II DNA or RNA helicase